MTEPEELDEEFLYGPAEPPGYEDADAFFAAEVEQRPAAVLRLFGETYTLPSRVPLSFRLLLQRHDEDTSIEALSATLAPLFGADALDRWIGQGVDDRQLGIVLAWSIANMAKPGSVSLAEAARAYDEQESGKAAAPRNREERRKSESKRGGSGKRSSRGGRS